MINAREAKESAEYALSVVKKNATENASKYLPSFEEAIINATKFGQFNCLVPIMKNDDEHYGYEALKSMMQNLGFGFSFGDNSHYLITWY